MSAATNHEPLWLAGRTALVTGAAERLGQAMAMAMAEAGADIVVHYHHSAAEAEATADRVRALGRRAWLVRADLADAPQAESLVDRAAQESGPLDILVNSAAIYPAGRLGDISAIDLALAMQVNAMAPLQLGRSFAAQLAMAAQSEKPAQLARAAQLAKPGQPNQPGRGATGDIVNLLDARVLDYDREHVAYHAAKRLLLSFTRMMALEFAPAVRVNAIAPGLILPPRGQDESYLQRLAETTPLRRHGGPEDVVAALLFLLRSQFVTGQVIYVDGGRHMKGNVYGG